MGSDILPPFICYAMINASGRFVNTGEFFLPLIGNGQPHVSDQGGYRSSPTRCRTISWICHWIRFPGMTSSQKDSWKWLKGEVEELLERLGVFLPKGGTTSPVKLGPSDLSPENIITFYKNTIKIREPIHAARIIRFRWCAIFISTPRANPQPDATWIKLPNSSNRFSWERFL